MDKPAHNNAYRQKSTKTWMALNVVVEREIEREIHKEKTVHVFGHMSTYLDVNVLTGCPKKMPKFCIPQ